MPSPPQTPAVLDLFEANPPQDRAERRRLLNVIRDEFDAFQRQLGSAAARGAAAAQALAPGPRSRYVLAWFRGTSLSFRFNVHDQAWAEDLWTTTQKVRRTFRLRPLDAPAAAVALPLGKVAKVEVAVNPPPTDFVPGDWIATEVRARNVGGNSGMAPIVTFGVARVVAYEEPPETGDVPDEDDREIETDDVEGEEAVG